MADDFVRTEYRLRWWNNRGFAAGRYVRSECSRCGAFIDTLIDKVEMKGRFHGVIVKDLSIVERFERSHSHG